MHCKVYTLWEYKTVAYICEVTVSLMYCAVITTQLAKQIVITSSPVIDSNISYTRGDKSVLTRSDYINLVAHINLSHVILKFSGIGSTLKTCVENSTWEKRALQTGRWFVFLKLCHCIWPGELQHLWICTPFGYERGNTNIGFLNAYSMVHS